MAISAKSIRFDDPSMWVELSNGRTIGGSATCAGPRRDAGWIDGNLSCLSVFSFLLGQARYTDCIP